MYTIKKITNVSKTLEKFPDNYFNIAVSNPIPKTAKWGIYPTKEIVKELFRVSEKVAYVDEHNSVISIYTRDGYQGEIPFTSYEDLILKLGKSEDLVLDFTCGTSRVAEACAKLGQDFIGLETDLRLYKRKIESVKRDFGYAIV